MKKVLVIGSNSFSGSSFIDFILDKKYQVIGVSRSFEQKPIFLRYKKNKNLKNYKFHKVDLNNDYNKLFKILLREKPNYIINFAAQGMVNESWKEPLDWYQTNIMSQIRILEFLKNKKFLKKNINFTTPEVYGNTEKWKKESFHFNPSTPYALSRASGDLHLRNMFNAFKFPVIFTRAANVFGESQQLYRIIPKSIVSFKLNRQMVLDGGGISERSFIHIDDVSNALFKILKNGKIGETYHISSKKIISIKNLVQLIADFTGINFDRNVKIGKERTGKDHSYKLDSAKLRSSLNWNDNITLEEGIFRTIKWVELNTQDIKRLPIKYIHKK